MLLENFPLFLIRWLFYSKEKCRISYTAPDVDGWYGVAVQIEDYYPNTNLVLSSVPLQFLVKLTRSSIPCGSEPIFVGGTPKDEACVAFTQQYTQVLVARSPINSRT